MKTAIVFATDEKFVPLAKGFVLSLARSEMDPNEFSLHMIDVGCAHSSLEWMASHGVEIGRFRRSDFFPRRTVADLKSYQDAQMCRPFLPAIFPGREVYLWCDSDLWVQDIDSLKLYRDIAAADHSRVPISPLVDASYTYFYRDSTEFSRWSRDWYANVYGKTIAATYANRTIFSSGVFAMHAKNPIWSAWAGELTTLTQKRFPDHSQLHLAEQTALNYLLYSRNAFVSVDAKHNYNCHIGLLKRDDNDNVVIDIPPYEKIGVVHLTYASKTMKKYVDNGLLFDSGMYLSEEERKSLIAIDHY